MKLLDVYANSCGVRVSEEPPQFPDNYFIQPNGRYITIHNSSGMDSKNYSYFSEVLAIIEPALAYMGIKVIQIGTEKDTKLQLKSILDYRGRTRLRQTAFIVKNSLLHIGNDTCWSHFCGNHSVPCITLYGTTRPEVCAPFYQKGFFKVLESDRGGKKATNWASEKPKTIDMIAPETVANAILDRLMDKEGSDCQVQSAWIGDSFLQTHIEVLPNCIIGPLTEGAVLNIRLDYMESYDPRFLTCLLLNHPSIIYTDREIDLRQIPVNNKLLKIFFDVSSTSNISTSYLDSVVKSAIDYSLTTKETDEKIISDLRFKYFDFKSIFKYVPHNKEFVESNKIWTPEITRESFVKSFRYIVSENKIYLTKWHLDNNMPIERLSDNVMKIGDAIDSPDFWSNAPNFYIFNTNT